ncbi:glycosyltransferase family A protein [soil metagenome]
MNGMNNLVSIILPVYNAASTLKAAVKSCLCQSYSNFELIIIDDGSIDETATILQKLFEKDKRIRLFFNTENKGIVSSLNFGIQEAKGKIIARMDADDIMLPARLAKQVVFLDNRPEIGLVSCLVSHGGDAVAQEGYATFIEWINSIISPEEIALNRFVESPLAHPSVMFRKELIAEHGGYRDGNFPEDYELWLRWMDAGVKMEKIPEVLLQWNDPPERLSRTDERYSKENFSRIKAGYLAEFITGQISGSDRKLWLCGAGRITRQKSAFLIASGLEIGGFVDVDPNKIGKVYNSYSVISLDELPDKKVSYVVSYVGNRGARDEIRRDLKLRGLEEGKDFVMAG